MRRILKKIGRIFVILTHEEEGVLRRSVLIVDNGYSFYEHLRSTVAETQRQIAGSDISVLTFEHRRRFLHENFHLLDNPEPCQADFCPCNEYGNLLE